MLLQVIIFKEEQSKLANSEGCFNPAYTVEMALPFFLGYNFFVILQKVYIRIKPVKNYVVSVKHRKLTAEIISSIENASAFLLLYYIQLNLFTIKQLENSSNGRRNSNIFQWQVVWFTTKRQRTNYSLSPFSFVQDGYICKIGSSFIYYIPCINRNLFSITISPHYEKKFFLIFLIIVASQGMS